MKRLAFHLVWGWVLTGPVLALQPWQAALARMPLVDSTPLNRSNCISVMLRSFHSNETVRAMIVLPAVTDDFYLVNRDKPPLNIAARDLNEAVSALTRITAVRVTFCPPFLLLHMDRDHMEAAYVIKDRPAADRLKRQHSLDHAVLCDRHWQTVQPLLESSFRFKFLPAASSPDAWHFGRHNIAGWNLTDWEWFTALSLSSRTAFTVQRSRVVFRTDLRPSPAAK